MTDNLDRAMLLTIAQELADMHSEIKDLKPSAKHTLYNDLVSRDERTGLWVAFIRDAYDQITPVFASADVNVVHEVQQAKQAEFFQRVEALQMEPSHEEL